MEIKWHEVTWYSKLGAIILFLVVVPVLCFYIGMQYQAVVDSSYVPQSSQDSYHPQSSADENENRTPKPITGWQTYTTSNGYTFVWPTGWPAEVSTVRGEEVYTLSDGVGGVTANIFCPITQNEGDMGVATLFSQSRTFVKDGKTYSIEYSEGTLGGIAEKNVDLITIQLVPAGADPNDAPQYHGTSCLLAATPPASASESRVPVHIPEYDITAVRKLYDTWK